MFIEVVKLLMIALMLVTFLGLAMANFGCDIRALLGCALNRIDLNRFVTRLNNRILRIPDNHTGTSREACVALLSREFGVVLTPHDFSQITTVFTSKGLELHLCCSLHSRWFYGRTVIQIVRDTVTTTERIIPVTELSGLNVPVEQ